MEPLFLLTAAGAFLAAEVSKKVAGDVVGKAYDGLKAILRKAFGRDPTPDDFTPETLRAKHLDDPSSPFVKEMREVVARSSALQRAQLIKPVLEGARLLWVDDHPENISYEQRALSALGVNVDLALSTDGALESVRRQKYDLILSDIARTRQDSGLILLRKLREQG